MRIVSILICAAFWHCPHACSGEVKSAQVARPWQVRLTANFKIYHRDADLAEGIARSCEVAREHAHRLLFPNADLDQWTIRCEVYVCDDAADFSKNGRSDCGGAGQSVVVVKDSQVVYRKIVLRCEDSQLLQRTLPHEVAHIVIGSHFVHRKIPVWLDEGMAALCEGMEAQQQNLTLAAAALNGTNDSGLQSVLLSTGYPAPHEAETFYAVSFALCKALVEESRAEGLVHFAERSLRDGVAIALQSKYELETSQLLQKLRAMPDARTKVAGRATRDFN